jgi:hypothetical protein
MEQISREFREICSIILFYRHKSPFAHCAISLFMALGIGSGNSINCINCQEQRAKTNCKKTSQKKDIIA